MLFLIFMFMSGCSIAPTLHCAQNPLDPTAEEIAHMRAHLTNWQCAQRKRPARLSYLLRFLLREPKIFLMHTLTKQLAPHDDERVALFGRYNPKKRDVIRALINPAANTLCAATAHIITNACSTFNSPSTDKQQVLQGIDLSTFVAHYCAGLGRELAYQVACTEAHRCAQHYGLNREALSWILPEDGKGKTFLHIDLQQPGIKLNRNYQKAACQIITKKLAYYLFNTLVINPTLKRAGISERFSFASGQRIEIYF